MRDAPTVLSRRKALGVALAVSGSVAGSATANPVVRKARGSVCAEQDYGVSSRCSPEANTAALQRALDAAHVVSLPSSPTPLELAAPVVVPPATQIVGSGIDRTRMIARGEHAFICSAGEGSGTIEAPVFRDFSLQCARSGIRFNSETGGFEEASGQQFFTRARLERVRLVGPGSSVQGTRGLELNKAFHTVVDQCEIASFDVGVKSLGSDFGEIRGRTRIWQCGTLIKIDRTGTLGSGFRVDGCDLLIPTRSFVEASDYHLIFVNNYLENLTSVLSGPVLDLNFRYSMLVQNNRFEVPEIDPRNPNRIVNPVFLRLKGEGVLFAFENNANGGGQWGKVDWNGDNSARYHWNGVLRQRIAVRNNSNAFPTPFRSSDAVPVTNPYRDFWTITPDTDGFVAPFNYAEHCRVRGAAFILPALEGFGSLVRFRGPAVTGRVNIHVRAGAAVDGQQLIVAQQEGGQPVRFETLRLSRDAGWHTPFAGVEAADLAIDMYNSDQAHGSEARIEAVVVERA